MADVIHDLLVDNLNSNDIINWLKSSDTVLNHGDLEEINKYKCSKGEFALYFLNYLRDETIRLLNTNELLTLKKPATNHLQPKSSTSSKIRCGELIQSNERSARTDSHSCQSGRNPEVTNTPKLRLSLDSKMSMMEECKKINAKLNHNPHASATQKLIEAQFATQDTKIATSEEPADETSLPGSSNVPVKKPNVRNWRRSDHDNTTTKVLANGGPGSNLEFSNLINNGNEILEKPQLCPSVPNETTNIPVYPSSNKSQNLGLNKQSNNSTGSQSPRFNSTNHNVSMSPINLGDFIVRSDTKRGGLQRKSGTNLKFDNPPAEPGNNERGGKGPPRRINPTRLNIKDKDNQGSSNFGTPSRTDEPSALFRNQAFLETIPQRDFNCERDLLRIERQKQAPNQAVSNPLNITASSKVVVAKAEEIQADITKVKNQDVLSRLVDVYSYLLEGNLILNLNTEVCWLINLLVVKDYVRNSEDADTDGESENIGEERASISIETEKNVDITFEILSINDQNTNDTLDAEKIREEPGKCSSKEKAGRASCKSPETYGKSPEKLKKSLRYLNTVHNCIYFATQLLNKLPNLLLLFDRIALRLLCDNVRVQSFSPSLNMRIKQLYAKTSAERSSLPLTNEQSTNVTFLYEIDNKQSFPTETSFHSFKKQRDGFYEIIQVWEKNHLVANWNFSSYLGPRIRVLMSIHDEPANYIHFSRLFRSQLLSSCAGLKFNEDEGLDESTLDFLKPLKEVNPEKYARLRERIVTPKAGESLLPDFPGQQEFYRDFIIAANISAFHSHLIDSLANELLAINENTFTASEVDDKATCVDEGTRSGYQSSILSMRLLAKFLGFIVFLPYRSQAILSSDIAETHLSLRIKILPLVDVNQCLADALRNRKLIYTIPWIVNYLSMIDVVSIHLEYYKNIVERLFHIYLNIGAQDDVPIGTVHVIKLSLGWLFESPSFPDSLYFSWCSTKDINTIKLYDDEEIPNSMDTMNLIDISLLYTLCPNMSLVKVILTSEESTNTTARHITPAPIKVQKFTAHEDIQIRLEESFFHGQTSSLKKTVLFVSERVASCCVKHISTAGFHLFKREATDRLTQLIEHNLKNKDNLPKMARQLATDCASEGLVKCTSEIDQLCNDRISAALPNMLPFDTLDTVMQMCIDIALRQSKEKAYTWIQTNIVPDLFMKEFQSELDKVLRNPSRPEPQKTSHRVLPGARGVEHLDSAPSPCDTINALRACICNIRGGQYWQVTDYFLFDILSMVRSTVTHREDLIPSSELVLHTLLLDLVLAIVSYCPGLLTIDLINVVVVMWKTPELELTKDEVSRLLSKRNIEVMLTGSADYHQMWTAMEMLLFSLLRSNLIDEASLLVQLEKAKLHSWTILPDVCILMATCINRAIWSYNQSKLLMVQVPT